MEQETAKFIFVPLAERKRSYPSLRGFILILISFLGFTFSSFGQNAQLSLDQGANGPANAPTSPVTWVNGNVNANKAHYVEGHSVPYRAVMTGLTVGQTVTLTMTYQVTHSNGYALDFITGDSSLSPHTFLSHSTPEAVDPLSTDVSGVPNTPDFLRVSIPNYISTSAVPGASNAYADFRQICDYNASGNPFNPNNKRNSISIFGATFVQAYGIQYAFGPDVLNLAAADQEVSFTVQFVPTQSTVVMAWGGHISRFIDWGNKTAALINGSPYHMAADSWSPPSLGNIGDQDRALQTSIAIVPPVCPGELMPPQSLCANAQGTLITCPQSACAGSTLYFKVPQSSQATTFVWFVSPSAGVTITPQVANPNDSFVAITFANQGTYQINVAIGNASTLQDTCRQNVTINPPTVCSITGDSSICSYDSTSFSGPPGMDSYSWTGPAGFTASTQSTGKITQQGTYTLVVSKNGCTSTCQQNLLVNLGSPAPLADTAARCGAGLVTLKATANPGYDSIVWFTNQQLTTRVDTGLTITRNLSATTTFYVVVKNSAGCFSLGAPAEAIINPIPVAPVPLTSGGGNTRCDTGVVTLTANSTDTSCKKQFWYTDSLRTHLVDSGSTFSPHVTATTVYWVACENSSGCFGPSVPVTATVNRLPGNPTTTPDTRCDTGIVHLSASSSDTACHTLIWYRDSLRTMQVATGPAYSPSLQSTTKFWVACQSSAGCFSASVPVIGTINKLPANPTTTPDTRCDTGIVHLMANTNDTNCHTLIWYQDSLRTMQVATGASYSPSLQSTTKFWVACQSAAGCYSASIPVIGTINKLPANPTTTPDTRCDTGIVHLMANTNDTSCKTLIWYQDSLRTMQVATGASYSPSLQSTTKFWVACQSSAGCFSASVPVIGTINKLPANPTTTPDTRCDTGIVHLMANTSDTNCHTLIWYRDSLRTMQVATGPAYSPSLQSTTTFWVACKTNAGCYSASVPVIGTINMLPASPTTTPDTRCDTGVVHLMANSSDTSCKTLIWYQDSLRTMQVATGASYSPSLQSTTTFWVA
ncbi:immunoglobulin domain-containing protein, partial [Taibaiella soli]